MVLDSPLRENQFFFQSFFSQFSWGPREDKIWATIGQMSFKTGEKMPRVKCIAMTMDITS